MYKGKGIIDAVRASKTKLLWWTPRMIIIMNGICDVTWLDRQTRQVGLKTNKSQAVTEYKESMDIVNHHIKILLDGNPVKVIFAQIVGLDIAKHNQELSPNPEQVELDATINSINVEIDSFNSGNDVISPWLARDIHKNTKAQKKSRYYKLGEDGVHLTPDLKKKWAIRNNCINT